MKYGSLKRQEPKSFKVSELNGGIDYNNPPDSMKSNMLSVAKNMWYKNSRLKTRPGFKADAEKAADAMIFGFGGMLDYKVTDTAIYKDKEYMRIATSDVETDDNVHYTYVYLLDLYGNITPIGNFSFLRYSSNVFYLPTRMNFFNGKPQKGGGIYAFISLCNKHNLDDKIHCIYEINTDFTEWERVYDYYIPTALINGRGDKYQRAKSESGFSSSAPLEIESLNMLESRFHSYFTTDGYSSSFKLPYNNLSNTEVICRLYHTLDKYVEWVIPADYIRDAKTLFDQEITAFVDRTTGTIYFKAGSDDYPIPVMAMCGDNNMKITVSKDVSDGVGRIVGASCVVRHNSKLLVGGGENGCTVYSSDYDNPLYFPVNASVEVGERNNGITGLSSVGTKVLAFKNNELYLLTIKDGDAVNKFTLLRDNEKLFKMEDVITSEQISSNIGCDNKQTLISCDGRNFWLGGDNKVYTFELSSKKIKEVGFCPQLSLDDYLRSKVIATGGGGYYILVCGEKLAVLDITDLANVKVYYWEIPAGITIKSGFYFAASHRFLCTDKSGRLAFVATLEGNTDSVIYLSDDGTTVLQDDKPISCEFITAKYCFGDKKDSKNIESIYLNMSAKGKVKINVNDRYKTEFNFGFLNEDYDKCEYKSVKLSPHLYNTSGVCLKLESDKEISIGEIEIQYRVTG